MPDPLIGAALVSGAANLFGGILGSRGQREANRQTLQIAREQMQFQERMSSTAYQRAAKDLEAAGLNRILALGSAASTPQGARAQMMNEQAAKQAGIEKAVTSALQARQLAQQLKNMEAVERREDSQTDLNRAQEDLVAEDIQTRRQQRQTEIARYADLMTSAIQRRNQSAYTLQTLPGITAEADLWRALNTGKLDEAAKALGMTVPALRLALQAARMLRMAKKPGVARQ